MDDKKFELTLNLLGFVPSTQAPKSWLHPNGSRISVMDAVWVGVQNTYDTSPLMQRFITNQEAIDNYLRSLNEKE